MLDGQLSFKSEVGDPGKPATQTIAIEMSKKGRWRDPHLFPPIAMRGITLNDAVINLERAMTGPKVEYSLAVTTSSTDIKNSITGKTANYKPAAFSFTLLSLADKSLSPRAVYINLATKMISIDELAGLAQVAYQITPQGQLGAAAMAASPYKANTIYKKLKLDQLPLNKIVIDNPKIYLSTVQAITPTFEPAVYPPLHGIVGAGVHVRGTLRAFGKKLGKSEYHLDFKGLKTDTKIGGFTMRPFKLSDTRFRIDARPGRSPAASFSGDAKVFGISLGSATIKLRKNNFSYDIDTGCAPIPPAYGLLKFTSKGSSSGLKISSSMFKSVPRPAPCVADPLELLKNALKLGLKAVNMGSNIVTGIGSDTWHGLRDLGRGKINPAVVTNAVRQFGNPANAVKELASKGKKAAKKISAGVKRLFGKKKKRVRPRYFNEPSKCNETRDEWSIEYAACWRKGHELIQLAANPSMCISVRKRIRENGKGVEIWKCEGGWHQQWRRTGFGDVRDGHAPSGKEWCWEEDRKNNALESRPCDTKQSMQKFHRDRFDRLVYNGRCLQVENTKKDGADINFNKCHLDSSGKAAHPYQRWKFIKKSSFSIPPPPLPRLAFSNRYKKIMSSAQSFQCIGVDISNKTDRGVQVKFGLAVKYNACRQTTPYGWRWSNNQLRSQQFGGICLGGQEKHKGIKGKSVKAIIKGAKTHRASVKQLPCKDPNTRWAAVYKVGNKAMFQHASGRCLAIRGRTYKEARLVNCNRNDKWQLFQYN